MKQMLTLIRRELIEHRSGWAVPAVFGGLFVLAAALALVGVVRFGVMDGTMTLSELTEEIDAATIGAGLQIMLMSIAMVLNLVMVAVVFFYFLDALYAERKDRSILFWKSLPVSDLQVVASKWLTGVVAIPLLTVVVFLVTGLLVSLIGGVGLVMGGAGEVLYGVPAALFRVSLMLLYTLVFQALWFAPVHGWLLLVSAYAKRAVLGWAVLPPLLVVVAEQTLFDSQRFAGLLGHRMTGGYQLAFSGERNVGMIIDDAGVVESSLPMLGEFLTPARLLAAPSLWVGIVIGVVFLAGAVWLRRWRDEA